MNREELPRIRLKVATTAGINILCTAMRKWKVSDWLPHIQQAFRQVREDQGEDQYSKKTFIRALRLKKGDFYIANSQIIGDVFEDNDEVHCEIDFSGQSKKQIKESKKNKKGQPKTQNQNTKGKDNKQPKIQIKKPEEKEIESQSEVQQSKPSKKIKIEKQKESHKQPQQIQEQVIVQNKKQIQKPKEAKPKKQNPVVDKSKNSQKFVKVDLTKLKSLLVKNEKKIENSPQPKIQSPQKSKQSNSQESS